MRLVFLGPPGAGKGTHAKVLAEKFRLAHLAAGDCLRRHIKEQTPLGKKAKDIIARGELVPDDLVNAMMAEEIKRAGAAYEGFILDGYPRTLNQAEALERMGRDQGFCLQAAVNFNTSQEVVIQRLSGRQVCGQCGANYHSVNIPPKTAGVCDRCSGALIQRKDDQPETIKNRIQVYWKETAPLIEFYAGRKLLHEINGNLELEPLRRELVAFFESLKSPK